MTNRNIVDNILNNELEAQKLRKKNVIVLHDFKFDTNKQMILETLQTYYKNKKESA